MRFALMAALLLLPLSLAAQPHLADSSPGDRTLVIETLDDVRTTLRALFGEVADEMGLDDYALTDEEASLQTIRREIARLQRLVERVRVDAQGNGRDELADRLRTIDNTLDLVANDVEDLIEAEGDTEEPRERRSTWLDREDREDRNDDRWEDEEDDRDDTDWSDRYDRRWDWHHNIDLAGVGDPEFWPYRSQGLYRTLPAIRYNRVEGVVLGAGISPLSWDSYRNRTLYGQVGYAFALKDIRYTVGVESFVGTPTQSFGLKVGAAYQENTVTNDVWKAGYTENTLAAFLFHHDFFDYYETEGGTVYASARFSPFVQLTAGFRSDAHRTLAQNTDWSLFRGDFRPNFNEPGAFFTQEGRMNSLVFALDAGEVVGLYTVPSGASLQANLEVAEGLGGDFNFTRLEADGRIYLPLSYNTAFGLRARGAYMTDDTPWQKLFTFGGIGTVRGFGQNTFFGTEALVANAEFILGDVYPFGDWFGTWQVMAFADAGWSNYLSDTFDVSEAVFALGGGVGFDDRGVRLEIAWPFNDPIDDRNGPVVWLRIEPNF